MTFNDIEGEHYDACPLGHSKIETTALYTRVATGLIARVESPLDLLSQSRRKSNKKPSKKPAIEEKDSPPA